MKQFDLKRIQEISNKIYKNANSKKEYSMSEMISRMKNYLNEEPAQVRYLTNSELDVEKKKFQNALDSYNVSYEYEPFMIVNNGVIWGGTIDGQIQWVFKVTDTDDTSGVEFNFSPDFNPDEGDNKKITQTIESYYNQFFKYWRDNEIELDDNNSPEPY